MKLKQRHWLIGAITLVTSSIGGFLLFRRTPRAKVVRAARSQLGSSDKLKYWQAVLPASQVASMLSRDWCGAFVLWALHEAGIGRGIRWIPGEGFEARHLTVTSNPQPGDVAYFTHNQHRSVVASVNPDGTVTTIDGNSTGGKVVEHTRPKSAAAAYFSIAPLL